MAEPQPAGPDRGSLLSPGARDYVKRTQLGELFLAARARPELLAAIVIAAVVAAIYLATSSRERQGLDYFVRLADALLHGRLDLAEHPPWLNELVPSGFGTWYVPYPPMPAIVLVPIVALFGPGIHEQVVSSIVGGLATGLAWLVFAEFALTRRARLLLTATFGLGTVLWYVSEVGSAWYFAHTVAVAFSMAAILLALRRQMAGLAGFLLGCATLARLPVGLGAPFLLAMLLGVGRHPRVPFDRRAAVRTIVAFAIGLGIPLALYGLYNEARWGTTLDQGYVLIPGIQDDPMYREHGILSAWYIPRNLFAIFLRSWNYVDEPPFLQPSWWGLSIFLTTPVYLWLAKARLRDPRVGWALVGTILVGLPIVAHGNVGATQFGYRFSLDFQPLLFVILATVFERGMSRLAVVAAGLAIATSAYAIWAIGIGFVAY